jgi:hypothetical protein
MLDSIKYLLFNIYLQSMNPKTRNFLSEKWLMGKNSVILKAILILMIILLQAAGTLLSQATSHLIDKDVNHYPSGTYPDGTDIVLPALRLNQTKTFHIPLLIPSPDQVNVQNVDGSCDNITNNHTISNSVSDITAQVTMKCDIGENSFLYFTLNVIEQDSLPDNQNYVIPIIRDTAKIVLTLDISGSMGSTVQGGTGTRIDALKNAVNMLAPKLEEFYQPGDSLGITYYSTILYQPELVNFPNDFIAISPNDASDLSSIKVFNDLDPRHPMNMTAMATGLLNAKAKLVKNKQKAPNTTKMVFLFTDGLQNWGPQVNSDGNTITIVPDLLNDLTTKKDSIRYYTIGTWQAGQQPAILNAIATTSHAKSVQVLPTSDLEEFFNVQLSNILVAGSPQIIFNRTGKNITAPVTYSFNLNDNVPKLLFELSTGKYSNISFRILKDGKNVTSHARQRKSEKYNMWIFDFPQAMDTVMNSGGSWTVTLSGNNPFPYNLAALADDHFLSFRCDLDRTIYTVGDTMKLITRLKYLGKYLTGSNNTVTAVILKPGDDIGQLLSVYPTPVLDTTDVGNTAEAKFEALMAHDSSFYNALLPNEQIVNLAGDGNGKFSGKYPGATLAGIYNVIFLINGETPASGKFERRTIVSSVYEFGQVVQQTPQASNSPTTGTTTTTGTTPAAGTGTGSNPKSNYTTVIIRPKNVYGNYMGPGFASKIKVVVNPHKPRSASMLSLPAETTQAAVSSIKDNLDGSYTIFISGIQKGSNPKIEITVRGEQLYNGKMWPIPWWYYLILFLLIILLLLARYFKTTNYKTCRILLWILTILIALIIILHYFGLIRLF